MNFKSALVFLISTSVATATPMADNSHASPLQARDCTFSYAVVETWVEAGMTRNRIDFSSVDTPTDEWCRWWQDAEHTQCGKFNPQCYYAEDPGTWRVDSSWFRGPAGDSEFDSCLGDAAEWWTGLTGCTVA